MPVQRYPEDISGVNPDNLVSNEPFTLSNNRYRSIAPIYGAYFKDSLIVKNNAGVTLTPNVHFKYVGLLQTATDKTGQAVYEGILIIDETVSSVGSITYQALGGKWQNDSKNIIEMYEAIINDTRAVDWVTGVTNKPATYPAPLHNHLLTDLYRFQYLTDAVFRVRDAIILSNIPAFEAILEYIENRTARGVDVTIDGPSSVVQGLTYQYLITNYDAFSDYDVVVSEGTVSINGANITYTKPLNDAVVGNLQMTVYRNGNPKVIDIALQGSGLSVPTVMSVTQTSVLNGVTLTITPSVFQSIPNGVDTHVSTSYEVIDADNGNAVVFSSNYNVLNKNSITTTTVPGNSNLRVRVRETGAIFGDTDWSAYFNILTNVGLSPIKTTPVFTSPVTDAVDVVYDNLVMTTTSSIQNTTDTKDMSSWQVTLASDPTYAAPIFESIDSAINIDTVTVPALPTNTPIIARMRTHWAVNGWSNWGEVNFTTASAPPVILNPPVITTTNLKTGNLSIVATALNAGTHTQTEWELYTHPAGVLVDQKTGTVGDDLLTWNPIRNYGQQYKVKARAYWDTAASFSAYSEATFTVEAAPPKVITKPSFINIDGQAFGDYLIDGPKECLVQKPYITYSPFVTDFNGTFQKFRFQIASDAAFTTILRQGDITDNVGGWQVTNPFTNDTYYLRGKYFATDGTASAWSDTEAFTVNYTPPVTPDEISAPTIAWTSPQTDRTPEFTRTAISANYSTYQPIFQYQIATNNTFTENLLQGTLGYAVTGTNFSHSGILSNGTYYVRARYIDENGSGLEGAWSATETITINYVPPPEIAEVSVTPTWHEESDVLNITVAWDELYGADVDELEAQVKLSTNVDWIVATYPINPVNNVQLFLIPLGVSAYGEFNRGYTYNFRFVAKDTINNVSRMSPTATVYIPPL